MADFRQLKIKMTGDKVVIARFFAELTATKSTSLLKYIHPCPNELEFDTSNSRLINAVKGKVYRGFRGVWDNLSQYESDDANAARKVDPDLYLQYKANYENHGYCTWSDWKIANWSTKWADNIVKIGKTYLKITGPFGLEINNSLAFKMLKSAYPEIRFELTSK